MPSKLPIISIRTNEDNIIKIKTLAEKRDWVIKQVAPTLAAIYHADGDLGFVYSVINSGTDRMSLELKQMVEEYLNGLAEGVAT